MKNIWWWWGIETGFLCVVSLSVLELTLYHAFASQVLGLKACAAYSKLFKL
ncbi:hypothetical protein I79_021059 [Cricetulus griseus]|uniref:Uncharacterized protein n=1 Tax=Cricetulus griseus TaxID=10029 RepID=G3IBM8_CRIGR|nr:hypothetical protein I79_021059 [Cricetulus griseus]